MTKMTKMTKVTKMTDLVPLDEVNALVPQRARPVRVDLRGNVRRKHQSIKRKSSKHQKFKAPKHLYSLEGKKERSLAVNNP